MYTHTLCICLYIYLLCSCASILANHLYCSSVCGHTPYLPLPPYIPLDWVVCLQLIPSIHYCLIVISLLFQYRVFSRHSPRSTALSCMLFSLSSFSSVAVSFLRVSVLGVEWSSLSLSLSGPIQCCRCAFSHLNVSVLWILYIAGCDRLTVQSNACVISVYHSSMLLVLPSPPPFYFFYAIGLAILSSVVLIGFLFYKYVLLWFTNCWLGYAMNSRQFVCPCECSEWQLPPLWPHSLCSLSFSVCPTPAHPPVLSPSIPSYPLPNIHIVEVARPWTGMSLTVNRRRDDSGRGERRERARDCRPTNLAPQLVIDTAPCSVQPQSLKTKLSHSMPWKTTVSEYGWRWGIMGIEGQVIKALKPETITEYRGRLNFALSYEEECSTFYVHVMEAVELPVKDITGTHSVYCTHHSSFYV